jgi:hypothetical protein
MKYKILFTEHRKCKVQYGYAACYEFMYAHFHSYKKCAVGSMGRLPQINRTMS